MTPLDPQPSLTPLLNLFQVGADDPSAQTLAQRLCQALCGAFHAERASIFRLQADGRSLRLDAATGLDVAQYRELSLKVGEGICGSSILMRRAINVFDARKSLMHDPRIQQISGYIAHSILAAPILFGGRAFGAIEVLGWQGENGFPGEYGEPLMAVAALYGARLAQERDASPPGPMPTATDLPDNGEPLILGTHPLLLGALAACLKAGASDDPVLIHGESGTGKELAARRIHRASARGATPLVTVNCAALSETLLESELFGHVAGAFTGAKNSRKGMFAAASGGTLFLDEIAEMSTAFQAKILRAIELGEILPVGAEKPLQCNVRVIAASNKDLWQEVRQGRFREDLFFRLSGIEIHMPPLRERQQDIPLLAEHFLRQWCAEKGLTHPVEMEEKVLQILLQYDWPGNVRELRQTIRSACAMADGLIRREHLPRRIRMASAPAPMPEPPATSPEEERYRSALRATAYPGTGRWNLSAAARQLGIPRRTFAYRLSLLGIEQ